MLCRTILRWEQKFYHKNSQILGLTSLYKIETISRRKICLNVLWMVELFGWIEMSTEDQDRLIMINNWGSNRKECISDLSFQNVCTFIVQKFDSVLSQKFSILILFKNKNKRTPVLGQLWYATTVFFDQPKRFPRLIKRWIYSLCCLWLYSNNQNNNNWKVLNYFIIYINNASLIAWSFNHSMKRYNETTMRNLRSQSRTVQTHTRPIAILTYELTYERRQDRCYTRRDSAMKYRK